MVIKTCMSSTKPPSRSLPLHTGLACVAFQGAHRVEWARTLTDEHHFNHWRPCANAVGTHTSPSAAGAVLTDSVHVQPQHHQQPCDCQYIADLRVRIYERYVACVQLQMQIQRLKESRDVTTPGAPDPSLDSIDEENYPVV